MPWIRVSVAVPGSEGEAAGTHLEGLGAVAVTWCDAGDAPVFEPLPGALPDLAAWPEVRAVGLFGLDVELAGVRSAFRGREIGVDFVKDEDWNGNWRRYAEIRRFGRLTVAPSHLEVTATDATVLRLDPGGAFGTGYLGDGYMQWANDEIFLAIQLETVRAAEIAEDILSVEGIDGCWIGPGDLSMSMGVDLSDDAGWKAHDDLIVEMFEATKRAGKIPGIWTGSASEALRRHEQGGLFLTTGGDGPWVVEGARRTLAELGR